MTKHSKYNEAELFLIETRVPSKKRHQRRKSLHPFIKLLLVVVVLTVCASLICVSLLVINKDVLSEKDQAFRESYTDVVDTDCGQVIGVKEFYDDKETHVFKGIPYAQPPIGDLRWKPPQNLKKINGTCWQGVYKADHFGNECVQAQKPTMSGSEDCLFLNVWTPTLNRNANLPVFVWIHGGSLIELYGNFPGYSPDSEFITSMNVVAISMNYRLNAFGFLTLEELWDENKSYGNYGIMDQILVLKWIQNNIKNFGGDPNSVTISGQSSGGTSIFGLLASPLADTLFHKAIPTSGSPKFSIDYIQASKDNQVFLNKTKCSSLKESSLIKQCLYNLTSHEIYEALPLEIFPSWDTPLMYDFPKKGVLDGALIIQDPIVIPVDPGNISQLTLNTKKSILTGTVAQEVELQRRLEFKSFQDLRVFLTKSLNKFSSKFPNIVLNDLYHFTEYETEKPEYLYLTLTTDCRMTCPNNVLAKSFSLNRKLQSYRFVVTNRPSSPIDLGDLFDHKIMYSGHIWDSIALFNFTMVRPSGFKPMNTDLKFRDNLREVVKEFMINGNLAKFNWYPNQTGIFSRNGSLDVLSSDYQEEQCKFWSDKSNGFVPYEWIN